MPRARTPEEKAAKLALARQTGRSNPAPQVKPGDKLSLQHGAYSPDIYEPYVDALIEIWLDDPDFPDYAKAPAQRDTLRSMARVQSRLNLMYREISEMTMDETLTEVTEARETVRGGGESGQPMTRKSRQKKTADYDDRLRRWETLRLNLAKELGLTPMAQTKMGRNVAATSVDLAQLIQQATEEDNSLTDEGEVG